MEMSEKKQKLILVTEGAGSPAPGTYISIYTKLTSTVYGTN